MSSRDITTKDLAIKLGAALYARGLLNGPTYENILKKYA